MTNYDKVFEINPNKELFYSSQDYPGNKLMVGYINFGNAIRRLEKGEFYTIVTYIDGEKLPKEYIPLDSLDNGELVATVNPDVQLQYICDAGSIQRITKMRDSNYFLGPGIDKGNDEFNLLELAKKNLAELKSKSTSKDIIEESKIIN